MALSFPSNPTNGQQYTDDNSIVWQYLSSKTVWNPLSDDSLKEFSGAKVVLDFSEALTANSAPVSWDVETFDLGGYFNLANNTKLTVTNPGFYRVNVLAITSTLGSGASYTFIVRKNGTTDITVTTAGPNQAVNYDEILQLVSGDYLELYAAESGDVGEILERSFFEIQNIGDQVGSAQSTATKFSGASLNLAGAESLTSSLAPITWDSTDYNVNADINGNVYWSVSEPSKIFIYTTGYYRVKSLMEASSQGSVGSYTVDFRVNGTSFTSASLSPNDSLDFDDMYNFTSGSYIEFWASESEDVGEITTDSYFQIIRQGV
jgi:hypothetical protein